MPLLRTPLLTVRSLRLGSGLVLFTYLATHLLNHALGLVSVGVAESGLRIAIAIWHSLPGTVLLYGAAGVHLSLALLAISNRRTLRMPVIEAVRILAGLTVPLLLIAHFADTRLTSELADQWPQYQTVVGHLVHAGTGGWEIALLAPGWVHGCLGLHLAFGRRTPYRRGFQLLFSLALLVPVFSALGFLSMAREIGALQAAQGGPAPSAFDQPRLSARTDAADAVAVANAAGAAGAAGAADARPAVATEAIARVSHRVQSFMRTGYFLLIALAVLTPLLRYLIERHRGILVTIRYPGRTLHVPRGWSVLEASRGHGLPHLSACGGRARCSTCRVQVLEGLAKCPPPGPEETQTLRRIRAGSDTRLACQLRPTGNITVRPELPATSASAAQRSDAAIGATGMERELVLVGVELDDATSSGRCLPGDLLYLSRSFVGTAVALLEQSGAHIVARHGDSLLAAFGWEGELAAARRQCLQTLPRLDSALAALSRRIERELSAAFHFRIEAHAGMVIVETVDEGTGAASEPVPRVLGLAAEELRQLGRRLERSEHERLLVTEAVVKGSGWTAGERLLNDTGGSGQASPVPAYSRIAMLASRGQRPALRAILLKDGSAIALASSLPAPLSNPAAGAGSHALDPP